MPIGDITNISLKLADFIHVSGGNQRTGNKYVNWNDLLIHSWADTRH